jgi:hypothetical protein
MVTLYAQSKALQNMGLRNQHVALREVSLSRVGPARGYTIAHGVSSHVAAQWFHTLVCLS